MNADLSPLSRPTCGRCPERARVRAGTHLDWFYSLIVGYALAYQIVMLKHNLPDELTISNEMTYYAEFTPVSYQVRPSSVTGSKPISILL